MIANLNQTQSAFQELFGFLATLKAPPQCQKGGLALGNEWQTADKQRSQKVDEPRRARFPGGSKIQFDDGHGFFFFAAGKKK